MRGEEQLLAKLVKGKNKYVKNDLIVTANIIEFGIYAANQLNSDVVNLVSLLRKGQESYYPLVIRHICHIREKKMSAI